MQNSISVHPTFIKCAYPIVKETIPQSALGYGTNNKYPQFPPLMSDGRAITAAWQHDAVTNAKLVEENNIKSNWEYRKYLTQNAVNVMEQNFRESSNDLGYTSRFTSAPSIQSNRISGISSPLMYNNVGDNTKHLGHATSDLKNVYLSREQLNSRKISPVVTQDSFIKFMNQSQPDTKK